ncbi:hypothetical protein Tco_1108873 [Tanacetum coccineum]
MSKEVGTHLEVGRTSIKKNDKIKASGSSKKRSREDSDEDNAKKQKLEDDAEKEELRDSMDVVLRDDIAIDIESLATKYPIKLEDGAENEELRDSIDVVPRDDIAIDVESLATKYPIVDWKTHVLTKNMMYYQIIRADGSSKNYKIFSEMLDDFDRQDVMDLHRLVYKVTTSEVEECLEESSQKGLTVPIFSPGDDPIDCLNKAMDFLTAVAFSRTGTSSSNSGSQNMAFVSAPGSTNEGNTVNVQVSTANSSVSTDSTLDSTANLSDGHCPYAFLGQVNQNERTRKKITINGSDTAGYDKSKVECFNCHKMRYLARECRAMVAIDGAGFDWSFMAEEEVTTNITLMAFLDSEGIPPTDDQGYVDSGCSRHMTGNISYLLDF